MMDCISSCLRWCCESGNHENERSEQASPGAPNPTEQIESSVVAPGSSSAGTLHVTDAPESSSSQHKMEVPGAETRRTHSSHDIFLSYSTQEKPFVEQLNNDLKEKKHHPFMDGDPDSISKPEELATKIFQAAEQCQLAVVVLSQAYLTSKWPMLVLNKFVEFQKTGKHPDLKLFPLFYKLSREDLKDCDVESKWKVEWRKLLEGCQEEEVEELLVSWSEAVKKIMESVDGLELSKFSNSEYQYGSAAVKEICKLVPPVLEWDVDHIQGYERLCEETCKLFLKSKGREFLGLYGTGGIGKTTLCKAMCSYLQNDFHGRVIYVEFLCEQDLMRYNNQELERLCLGRLKRAIQQLAYVGDSDLNRSTSVEQGWKRLEELLKDSPPVFLLLDNVFEFSQDEAQTYMTAGLPQGSKVLVTSRRKPTLESVFGRVGYAKPIPTLNDTEAMNLLLSTALPNQPQNGEDDPKMKMVGNCLRECQFKHTEHHPLLLRVLGTFFRNSLSSHMSGWEEAVEKLRRGSEVHDLNDILGLNYHSCNEKMKLAFLYLALFLPVEYDLTWRGWWTDPKEWSELAEWVSWLSEAHGVSTIEAKRMVWELQRLGLLEGTTSTVSMHGRYKEFARHLVEQEQSKEWQWFMCREGLGSNNTPSLKRLYLYRDENNNNNNPKPNNNNNNTSLLLKDKSRVGCAPRNLQEWCSLIFLELWSCTDIGPDLNLSGLRNLRVLGVSECPHLERILCNCNNGEGNNNDGLLCSHRTKEYPGCLLNLQVVRLYSLWDLEYLPFLRHCGNLESLRIYGCEKALFYGEDDVGGCLDVKHLQSLHTLSLRGFIRPSFGADFGMIVRWLRSALQLKELVALEYAWFGGRNLGFGGETIDLGEVEELAPKLSVLSLGLPELVEMKGLHLLPELTTLNLFGCRGLMRLPDLKSLSKLERICVHGCCNLEDLSFGAAVARIGEFSREDADMLRNSGHSFLLSGDKHTCLVPWCNNCAMCGKRKARN